MLAVYEFGNSTQLPALVIAHGLFGSARNWRAIAKHLSKTRKIITVDMRNHGHSFWDDDHSYEAMAEDLAAVIEQVEGPIDLMGHSMGGKACMILALTQPDIINRLVIVDIAPIAYSHSQMHGIEAMKSVDLNAITRRSEADNYLEKLIPDAPTRAFFLQSLVLDDAGNRWSLNLNSLAKNMDKIIGFPTVAGQFGKPCLFLTGGASDYVSEGHHEKIATYFPNSKISTIPEAGHWVHAEAMKPFIEHIEAYLN